MKSKKYLPLVLLLTLLLIFYFSGLSSYFTFDSMKEHRKWIQSSIDSKPILAPILFILVYLIATALSFPGAIFFSLFGGFFFGWVSAIYTTIGATIGATILFSIVRTAFGNVLKKRAFPFVAKMKRGFANNPARYLLVLRLLPLFPFWLVNLVPVFFGVSLRTFIWTTALGILPGSFVYTQAGYALGKIFETGENFSLQTVLSTQIKLALFLLCGLFLLPMLIKKYLEKRPSSY